MAGGCSGWSKERRPSGRMKDLDLKDQGCTLLSALASLGWPHPPWPSPLYVLHGSFTLLPPPTVVYSTSLLLFLVIFTFLPLLTIPKAKLTNIGKKTNFSLNSVVFFLWYLYSPPPFHPQFHVHVLEEV